MFQSVHFDGEKLLADPVPYLAKHDIVYQAPAYQGHDGLPIGTGDIGGLLYHTPEATRIQINKTDAIDYAPDGRFDAWSWQSEERNTAPVSCGMLSITDGMPSFDWPYLEAFEERLSLGEATVYGQSGTPFSAQSYRVFASSAHRVLAFEMDMRSAEPVERRITLEKWSSINLFHDYEQIKPIPSKNLFNVTVGERDRTVYIEQKLRGTHYITALRIIGCPYRVEKLNARAIQCVLSRAERQTFRILLTVVCARGKNADLDEAIDLLNAAEAANDALESAHRRDWADFWSRGFVCLPGDDYIENLYYINLYQLRSCSLGKLPITFAGLWSWYKDTRNWGHYYHWNHQQTYWGVHAAGHPELAAAYYDYRFGMLENAQRDARELFGISGAFFSDIANLNGYQAIEPDTVRNLTVGAQIALDFYRHYRYTMDEQFLKDRAFKVMKAAADFYISLLKKEPDGCYRVPGGCTCYESYWNLRETITDWASIHALLGALSEIADRVPQEPATLEKYADVLKHLYPMPTTDGVLSVGRKWDGQAVKTGEGDYPLSAFPLSELSAVYPSGQIGLSQQGTPEFTIAKDTARLLFDLDIYAKSSIGSSGHSVAIQTAARLGMRDDAARIIRLFAERYQCFPNGLTHFADIDKGQYWSNAYRARVLSEEMRDTAWEELHEKTVGQRTLIPSDSFLHCYFESAANIMTGIQEMLLQSHDGLIRVCPATEPGASAVFSLAACGGFFVTAELSRGEVRFVHLTSEAGMPCRIVSPWPTERVRVLSGGREVAYGADGDILQFDTEKNGRYLLTRCEYPLENYYKEHIHSARNEGPKHFRGRIIGQHSLLKGRFSSCPKEE